MSYTPPIEFGPYQIKERIGIGGMASVHRASEFSESGSELREVALKRLLPHLADDESFVKSFAREAKLASLLKHKNIVAIHEFGRVKSNYFISMELIEGRDVRKILRQAKRVVGPPPVNVTLGILTQVCKALEYAHTRCDEDGTPLGIVHRDISPSNLIVTKEGVVKLIDFGIARAQTEALRTTTGRIKGKLAYMAPEACQGKVFDARSDLFSLGVIAHELLTATPLFAAKNDYETLMRVQRAEVLPPSAINSKVPHQLDDIVLKILEKERGSRYESASELLDDLKKLRKRYKLTASTTEVANWMRWAFAFEDPPISGQNTPTNSRSASIPSRVPVLPKDHNLTSPGFKENDGVPVILPDVPDVSERLKVQLDSLSNQQTIQTPPRRWPRATDNPPMAVAPAATEKLQPQKRKSRWPIAAALFAALCIAGIFSWNSFGKKSHATQPAYSKLSINVSPSSAMILVNGRKQDSPQVELQPGEHTLEIHAEGFSPWTKSVKVTDTAKSINVALQPIKSSNESSPLTSTVVLEAGESRFDVLVNGKKVGIRTPAHLSLPAGKHVLALQDSNRGIVWSEAFVAAPGKSHSFQVPLTQTRAKAKRRKSRYGKYRGVVEVSPTEELPHLEEEVVVRSHSLSDSKLYEEKSNLSIPSIPVAERATKLKPKTSPSPKRVSTKIVLPTSVRKISGTVPTIRNHGMQGKLVSAKICTSKTGYVSSAQIRTSIPPWIKAELVKGIRRWKFSPYKENGQPIPVCFAKTLRMK